MNKLTTCLVGLAGWVCLPVVLWAQSPTAYLSGCVFNDQNVNHQWDAGEPTLPGWEVLFTDLTAGTSQIVTTDSTGCYEIELAPDPAGAPHSVVLLLNVMPGYDQTYPTTGGYTLTVLPGQNIEELDFGVVLTVPPTATLHICKWEDRNCNGHWDDDEEGLANWPFRIVNTATNEEIIVHTEPGGCVNAEVPAPATYRVEEAHNGNFYVPTWPIDPPWYEVVAVPDGYYEGLVFGNNIPTWIFTACVFHDLNCNGMLDPGEPPLPDWPITHTTTCPSTPNLITVANLTTGASGCASDEGAWACSHTFHALSQPGWFFSTDSVSYISAVDSLSCVPAPAVVDMLFGVCQVPPPDTCGAIVEEVIETDTCINALQTVQYSFFLTNLGNQPVTSFLLTGLPDGATASPQYFSMNNYPGAFPILPGATAGPFSTTIAFDAPPGEEFCVQFILFSNGEECCRFDHCIALPPLTCEGLDVEIVSASPLGTNTGAIHDDCCYELRPWNEACFNVFGIDVLIETPNVVFTNYSADPDWVITLLAPDHLRAYWNGGPIPKGAVPPFTFCVNTDDAGGQPITFTTLWIFSGPNHPGTLRGCADSTEVECSDCAVVTGADQVVCNADGTWTLPNLCVYNQSDETPSVVLFEVQTPGIAIVPDMLDWMGDPTCTPLTLQGGSPGDVVLIKVWLLDEISGWCCYVWVEVLLDCPTPCIDSTLINLDEPCPAIYDPVCGCDGVTYNNACEAAQWHGITSWTPGPCPDAPCVDSSLINPLIWCTGGYEPVCGCNGVTYFNSCVAIVRGGVTSWTPGPCDSACVDSSAINPDVICPAVNNPVCGCDGVTYDNVCVAFNEHGITSWTPGPCPDTACIDSSLIIPTGICVDVYDPVCGCNGVTYYNSCVATLWSGVTSWTPGPCDSSCIDTSLINPDVICPVVNDPVCGCDGVTYYNACVAYYRHGITSWTPGPCPGVQSVNPADTLGTVPILLRPNPVSDLLYVDMPQGAWQLRVLSAEGRLVEHLQVQAERHSPLSIDVSHLPQGLYLLQVTDAKGRMGTARFVRME